MRLSKIARPGPGGTLIVPAGTRVGGVVEGSPGLARTKKQLDALRSNGFRNGNRSKGEHMTLQQALDMQLRRVTRNPRAPERVGAYVEAMKGNLTPLDRVAAVSLAKQSLILDSLHERVAKDGPVIDDVVHDAAGNVISRRPREHPGLGPAIKIAGQLGFTAAEQLLTPASRGSAERDDAITKFLNRQRELRESLALNAIPSEAVEEDGDVLEAELAPGEEEG